MCGRFRRGASTADTVFCPCSCTLDMVSCVPAGEHAAQVGSELPADCSASRSSKTTDSRTGNASEPRADVLDAHTGKSANNAACEVTSAILTPIGKTVVSAVSQTGKRFASARRVLVDAVVTVVIEVASSCTTKRCKTSTNNTAVLPIFVHGCRQLGATNCTSNLMPVQRSNAKQGGSGKQLAAVPCHKTRLCFLVFHALVFAGLLVTHPSHAISTFGVDSLLLELRRVELAVHSAFYTKCRSRPVLRFT